MQSSRPHSPAITFQSHITKNCTYCPMEVQAWKKNPSWLSLGTLRKMCPFRRNLYTGASKLLGVSLGACPLWSLAAEDPNCLEMNKQRHWCHKWRMASTFPVTLLVSSLHHLLRTGDALHLLVISMETLWSLLWFCIFEMSGFQVADTHCTKHLFCPGPNLTSKSITTHLPGFHFFPQTWMVRRQWKCGYDLPALWGYAPWSPSTGLWENSWSQAFSIHFRNDVYYKITIYMIRLTGISLSLLIKFYGTFFSVDKHLIITSL